MKKPTLSVIIPTPGRGRPLERTLRSIAHQRGDAEVIVCHDAVDGADPEVRRLCKRYRCRYLELDFGQHSWGHFEINAGIAQAAGKWIVHMDDDDVFTPDAFASIRREIAALDRPRPLLFKFMTPWRDVLWAEQELREGRIGGHCFVPPNIPARLVGWTARYQGDWDYIRASVDRWPNKDADVVWREPLIAWTRPTDEETARLIPQETTA